MKFFIKFLILFFFIIIQSYADDDWTQQSPSSIPSARYWHAMAFIENNKAILFGGLTVFEDWNDSKNGETWVFDFSTNQWTQKLPSSSPSARNQHAMAYLGDDKVLLFGGWSPNNETSTLKPGIRDHHGMAYIGDDKVLLFAGYSHNSTDIYGDTWIYDLSENTWTLKNPSTAPSARYSHSMAYIGNDQVLSFGGWDEATYFNDTWVYDLSDNNWTQDFNDTKPSGRRQHKISETSMDGSSYLVLFGGYDGSALNDETWTFGGGDYSLPVELSSFTANARDNKIILHWTTASETNNQGFILKRADSKNGEYKTIAHYASEDALKGAGDTSEKSEYSFIDRGVFNGFTYWYKLSDIDINGVYTEHNVISATPNKSAIDIDVVDNGNFPEKYNLYQNYPNPFNPNTTIRFDIPDLHIDLTQVNISVFNSLGQDVVTLFTGKLAGGSYE